MKNSSPAALRARIKVLEAEVAALRAASAGRACAHCGEPFHPHNATARTCSPRCRVALHRAQKTRTRSVIAKRAAATRKRDKMRYAYFEKFPGWAGEFTPEVDRAMERALETGKDQPLLIEQRKADAEIAAERQRGSEQRTLIVTRPKEVDYAADVFKQLKRARKSKQYADRVAEIDLVTTTIMKLTDGKSFGEPCPLRGVIGKAAKRNKKFSDACNNQRGRERWSPCPRRAAWRFAPS